MRTSRRMSATKVYHVMIRGNEKMKIFLNDDDRLKFLNILSLKGENEEFKLYAYCLMGNHVHLIIKEENQDISTIMSRINTSYAIYFNKKYDRVGHVFQDRFKSEPIETQSYLLSVIRYVHNNPVKAKIVKEGEKYLWSSYNAYVNAVSNLRPLDINFILSLFSSNKSKAIKLFKYFSNLENNDEFIDINDKENKKIKKLTTREHVNNFVIAFLVKNETSYDELMNQRNNIKLRDKLIRELKNNSIFSVRELANILGINRNIVQRAK